MRARHSSHYWWVAAPIGLDAVISWARNRGQFTDKNAPYCLSGHPGFACDLYDSLSCEFPRDCQRMGEG